VQALLVNPNRLRMAAQALHQGAQVIPNQVHHRVFVVLEPRRVERDGIVHEALRLQAIGPAD